MNIRDAKAEIVRTFRAYQKRAEDGSYRIPVEKQRPLLMIGPPGIGKTAIMQQIADETGCGLKCYVMTHHTRQSAIGLPFIEKRVYGGRAYSVTEYTMSEIIASVYDYIEQSGHRTGILFLDEINCVSETLAPVMLQLLQNKTFGVHALPEGWMIVAAGNPPEYNKSVREMDMATLDRVKHLEISADLDIWRDYALCQGVHPAILGYLSLYPDHFYRIDDTPGGRLFVTARGWEDMSCALKALEEDGETVSQDWFLQYLQHDEIARGFALFYRMYRRMAASDGDIIERLLADDALSECLTSSECLELASMLFHPISREGKNIAEERLRAKRLGEYLEIAVDGDIGEFVAEQRKGMKLQSAKRTLSVEDRLRSTAALEALRDMRADYIEQKREMRFSAYAARRMTEAEERLSAREQSLAGKIERAYRLLERCREGEGSLLFFTTDIVQDAALSALMKACPVEAYTRNCLKLI